MAKSTPSSNVDFFGTNKELFGEIEDLAHVGGWVLDIESSKTHWTSQVYRIHEVDELITNDEERSLNYYTQPSRSMLSRAITETINKGTEFSLKLELKTAKGNLKNVLLAGRPITKNNVVVKIVGAIQDISEIEAKLRELVDEQIKTAKAESIANFGYYETNLIEGTWTGSERFYSIFGFDSRNEPFSMEEFQDMIHPDDAEEVVALFADCLTKQKDFLHEYRCINQKTEEIIWVRSTSKVEYNFEGTPQRILGVKFDITDSIIARQKLENSNQKLEERNKQLQEYAYITSHDLKSPLNNMISFLDLIKEDIESQDNEELKGYMNYVTEASERMKLQISTLLDHGKIGLNREIKDVDPNEILEKLKTDLRIDFRESKAELEFKKLPIIQADSFEIRVLFQNLLSNCIKYRDPSRDLKIVVECDEKPEAYHFVIKDNGMGIEEGDFKSIFEMFVRTKASMKIKGTGVGLAQCKKIIDLNKGKLWVESKKNEGSAFHFTIAKEKS